MFPVRIGGTIEVEVSRDFFRCHFLFIERTFSNTPGNFFEYGIDPLNAKLSADVYRVDTRE
jgi:hypothetical protein